MYHGLKNIEILTYLSILRLIFIFEILSFKLLMKTEDSLSIFLRFSFNFQIGMETHL